MERNLWSELDRLSARLPSAFRPNLLTPREHPSYSAEDRAVIQAYAEVKQAWWNLSRSEQEAMIDAWKKNGK